jgi:predicted metal-binding membrane protein
MVSGGVRREADGPRAAFGVLSWQINLIVVIALVLLSLLAWYSTIGQAESMSSMVMGLGQIGGRAQGDMSATVFLTMWVTMMVAMMLPTIAPFVLAHLGVTRRRNGSAYATLAFVAGYLIIWSAIGVAPLIAYKAFARLSADAADSMWLPALAGCILFVVGAYQFTGWKRVCLDHCQSPFAFIAMHDFGSGAWGSLRAGMVHGAFCLGCCWALTAVLLVVGLMNLMWMAGIFVVFFIEKSWRHGVVLAKTVGGVLMVLGVAVMLRPALLPWISA